MKNKYMFGGLIIVVFLGVMGWLFTQTNVAYVSNFESVVNSSKAVKATGSWVKEKRYVFDSERNTFSFYMSDETGKQMKVIYKGSIPNNFESCTSVVVTGKYHNGVFQASDILTKCPSKYETQMPANSKT
ncbi:MAG: cytochrome c maturation protein CcmE [Ignavibacteriales bacterium]|nr:cytochrome c maturation protein CcmE [Ignavibacteriales bacterium]MCF8315622.1 cytochrome c maturation protein CcmE [Ignavibacteriales bacterium]MCF8437184.1 cytochrome c maturation protein CcmE [Ignavibacteriales bacterium]